ncbi:glycosyltransferase family 4 protein [Halomarina salina]|uniref:Glycosyltransferase family 4 protein n=1 Tax=Halomarina salina TaxID=1872699 RepID=A0ABD5RHN8_9EURY|nr:glycosyltransferase family 4 protein [Halomarina salina]
MRVLRIAQDVFPETVGGAPYHIHALSRDQARNGHDVTVCTVSSDETLPDREETDGYTIVRQTPKLEIFGNQLLSGTSRMFRDTSEFDVVHLHSHLFFSSNVGSFFARFSDTPVVVTCHGLLSQTPPEWVSKAHLRTLGRWTYGFADRVFCYTDVERRRLRELGVDTEIDVIPNGIDTKAFSPTGDVHREIDDDPMAFVFVGRLVDGKRPMDVLHALEAVRRDHPDATLYFCGDGPLRQALEARVREQDLSDAVTFLGHVPYEEMPAVYRAADCLVLASRTEGFPRTVMESLSCETPAVTSHLDQIAPLVNAAGATVQTGDVDGFAREMSALADDRDHRESLGQEGRQRVLDAYRWEDLVEKTTEMMQVAIDRQPVEVR